MPIAPMITWCVWIRVASLMMGRALKAKYKKHDVPTSMRMISYHGMEFTFT